jgi:nitroreductase
MSLLAPH